MYKQPRYFIPQGAYGGRREYLPPQSIISVVYEKEPSKAQLDAAANNPWINFVKAYAEEKRWTYAEALKDKAKLNEIRQVYYRDIKKTAIPRKRTKPIAVPPGLAHLQVAQPIGPMRQPIQPIKRKKIVRPNIPPIVVGRGVYGGILYV
jgi:hypothetical protein